MIPQEQKENNNLIILCEDKNGNDLYKEKKDGLWGVINSSRKLIVEHQYNDILSTGIHADGAGWGGKPWKYFLILLLEKQVQIFSIQTQQMLPLLFQGCTTINSEFLFVDTQNDFWVLDYKSESAVPCRYDTIRHALTHKESIRSSYEVRLKEYADRYFENFVSRYTTTASEKSIVKKYCYNSIEKPETVLAHIEDLIGNDKFETANGLVNYVEKLLSDKFSNPRKKEKAYFGACYFFKGKILYFLGREKEAIAEFEKSLPFLDTLKAWQRFWVYYYYTDCLLLTGSSATKEIQILKMHYENLSGSDKKKTKADFNELVKRCEK